MLVYQRVETDKDWELDGTAFLQPFRIRRLVICEPTGLNL